MRAIRAGQSALLLLDAVDVLAARKIPYAVIGAMIASVHGILLRVQESLPGLQI